MVVGIVIGSGVFFKAEAILTATNGDLPMGILAWVIGGLIMVFCACAFAVMATKYEYAGGLVDYADVTVGKKYGYYIGWFMATVYTPALTGVLAWVSARYLCVLLGLNIAGPDCMIMAMFFLVGSFVLNALAPKAAGKFQVSTTVIKLIPILLMAVIGTIVGLKNGMTVANFTAAAAATVEGTSPLFKAIVATAFAYEGWIMATSINAELKDAKRNLPIALVVGAVIIILTYILYFIGIAGAVPNAVMMESGQEGARIAFSTIFGEVGGAVLFVFVVISCLGTLNGLMMGCTRSFHALGARGVGPKPNIFKQVDPETNMATNASIMGMLFAAFWLLYFFGANLAEAPWFGPICFDSSELPIVALYAMYIPMFIQFMRKEKEFSALKRFVIPALAVVGSIFMVIAAIYAHGMAVVWFLVLYVVFMIAGIFFSREKK